MPRTTWTPEEIKAVLARRDRAATEFVGRAVHSLFLRQTEGERVAGATVEHNGRGFNGPDAEILSSFARFWKKAGFLTPKQTALARRKLVKYARQLAEIAAEKAAEQARQVAEAMLGTDPEPGTHDEYDSGVCQEHLAPVYYLDGEEPDSGIDECPPGCPCRN